MIKEKFSCTWQVSTFKAATLVISDGVKDTKPRNPRETTPNFKTPTRPQKAEPESTPTLDFNYKPRNPWRRPCNVDP